MLETMRQMYQFAVSMQPPPPAPAPPPVAFVPQGPPVVPPPPTSMNPADMLAYMRQMSDIVQQLMAVRTAPAQAAPPAAYPPAATSQPPRPGHIWIEQLQTYVPLATLARALSEPSRGPVSGPPPDGSGYPPSRSVGPSRGPHREREIGQTYPPYQPPRERSVVEQFRDSISVVRTVANMAQEANEILGGGEPSAPAPEASPEDDGPMRVMKFGDSSLAFDRESGAFELVASLVMNGDRILKAANEHIIQPLQQRRQASQQQPLPSGHVVLTPDYRPPPGMIAVPVDQLPPGLPDLPPPISEPAPAQRSAWNAPITVEGNGIG